MMSGKYYPRYDLETVQKGAGTAADPLIPQNAEQMRKFADDAARRVRSVEPVSVDVDGTPARLLDLYREEDGTTMGLVKFFGGEAGVYMRLMEITPSMVGLDDNDDMLQMLMPLLQPREVIPARLLHRDPDRITGQIMDVFVHSDDPLHLMSITKTDDTEAGIALQMMMDGTDTLPKLVGRSMEVNVRPGVDWSNVDEPKGYLTGIIPTAVPKMANSRQELELTKDMGAKGGSAYSFHTPLSPMSQLDMNDAASAVANSSEQKLNSGADEHGLPTPKRGKNLEGQAAKDEDKLEADFRTEIDAAHDMAKRAQAENAQLKAIMQIQEFEKASQMTFDDLVSKMREIAETDRERAAVDVMTKVRNQEEQDDVQDMILENPQQFEQVQADFSFMARAVHREAARIAVEQQKLRDQEAAETQAKEQRRQALLMEAQARRQANFSMSGGLSLPTGSFSSSSSGTTLTTTTTSDARSTSETSRQAADQSMDISTKLAPYLMIRKDANFSTGENPYSQSTERGLGIMRTLLARGIPEDVVLSWAKNRNVTSNPQSKRGREF